MFCNNETGYFMSLAPRMSDEELINMAVTLIYQCIGMLSKLIELVKDDFLKNGGIKEQMLRARLNYRGKRSQNNQENNDNKN